jgi:hypothetical protein
MADRKITEILDRFREAWQDRFRAGDREALERVKAKLRKLFASRADEIHEDIEALWEEHLDHWTGIYKAHYSLTYLRTKDADKAHSVAMRRIRRLFFQQLRGRWVDALDRRVQWMWAGDAAREVLEEIDGGLFDLLVGAAFTTLQKLTASRPLLTMLSDKAEEVLFEVFTEDLAPPTPEPPEMAPVSRRERPEGRDSILSEDGSTLLPIEEAEDLDQDTDEDEEGDTVVATDPTATPARAPFPEVQPVSSLRRAVERTLHKSTLAGKTTDRLKGIVGKQREALRLSDLTLPTPAAEGGEG